MKTMKWLLKREFWENKGAFFWAPLIVSLVMLFFILVTLVLGNNLTHMQIHYTENGQPAQTFQPDAHVINTFGQKFGAELGDNYMLVSVPIFLILGFVVFFYCLNTLYDERRDRSILFWKSLPISDRDTVLSKLAMALVVTPLIFMVIAFGLSLIAVLMACVAFMIKGVNIFGMVLASPDFYLAPIKLIATLPIYVLWALPTVGWLMMVSAWARSKVFLWAAGAPVLSIVLAWWAKGVFGFDWDVNWYAKRIIGRLLLSVFPGGWVQTAFHESEGAIELNNDYSSGMSHMFNESMAVLHSANLWIGAIVGVAMIIAAIYFRRKRED